jgi:hypothetical protein
VVVGAVVDDQEVVVEFGFNQPLMRKQIIRNDAHANLLDRATRCPRADLDVVLLIVGEEAVVASRIEGDESVLAGGVMEEHGREPIGDARR